MCVYVKWNIPVKWNIFYYTSKQVMLHTSGIPNANFGTQVKHHQPCSSHQPLPPQYKLRSTEYSRKHKKQPSTTLYSEQGDKDENNQKSRIWPQIELRCMGFLSGTSGKEPACQCRRCKRHRFDPWVGKIPYSRKWQSTPVFLPGKAAQLKCIWKQLFQ